MSRRSKVLLLLVTLGLVSLAAVDFVLTWSPQDPLRFRVITPPAEKLKKSIHSGEEYVDGYQVQVENMSGATLRILKTDLISPEESDGSRTYFSVLTFYMSGSDLDSVIPPHGSRRFDLSMFESKYVAGLPRSEMRYSFLSRSKENYTKLLDYLDRKWPSLSPSLSMRFYTDLDGHTTPVQMSGQ
jgi:hypothetical protein